MSDPFLLLVITLQAVLLLAGLAWLWKHVLAPDARASARSAARDLPIWAIPLSDFFFFLWIVLCGGLLGQAALSSSLQLTALDNDMRMVLAGGGLHLGMLAGVLGFRIFSGRARPSDSGRQLGLAGVVRAGVVTFVIALPLLTVCGLGWQFLLVRLGLPTDKQDLIDLFANAESPGLIAMMVFLATLVAPVTEELLFRAGLFRYARTRLPRWAALLLPACLFGALHANLASFLPLAVLGVIFALAYERTGSIAVPIIAHGLFNLNTILLLFAGIGVD